MKDKIEVKNISKVFSNQEYVLKGISLNIVKKTFNVLLGQSGSGKSTLLNIMSGLLNPTSGGTFIDGKNINTLSEKKLADIRRNRISNIYQDYMLLSELTVQENIELGKGKDNLELNDVTKSLGITKLLNKYPSQLSGGQRQRVAIARAIIKKPEVLFCDEATGALDEENSQQVVKLLHDIKEVYGITIVFATHNLKISMTADRVVTIKDGIIAQDIINKAPLSPFEINWGIQV
ncbi:ABC transporter ATP-binding protein [Sedimentibacter sp. zth1]|uniref:ABC transporter ATP-binding protein n=1 Tax=Sedimentibacter sp. zth1 TaxID=2816908 RepID=UPI001A9233A8|nr:ABC transporter ATP-binding protein [Sedimentibacter sp. zth1]QSX06259.1 ABC transporter ATP-binding protein [Sedimentibacter sp. zth1]